VLWTRTITLPCFKITIVVSMYFQQDAGGQRVPAVSGFGSAWSTGIWAVLWCHGLCGQHQDTGMLIFVIHILKFAGLSNMIACLVLLFLCILCYLTISSIRLYGKGKHCRSMSVGTYGWSESALFAFLFIRLFLTKKRTVQILIRWMIWW
jgi:hypothetical protein